MKHGGSQDSLETAKKLFLKYAGSHYFMAREGEYDLYRSFQVPVEYEMKWAEEYQEGFLEQIAHESDAFKIGNLVTSLHTALLEYNSPDIVSRMLDTIGSKTPLLDSFSKLLVAEIILRVAEHSPPSTFGAVVERSKKIASDVIRSVMDNPITVAPGYMEMNHLKGLLTEERIRLRASSDLERCKR